MGFLFFAFGAIGGRSEDLLKLNHLFRINNLFALIFLASAFYLLLQPHIPLLKFENDRFRYNGFILRDTYRGGAFFPLFPYLYRNLSSFKLYTDISKAEQKNAGIILTKKDHSTFTKNPVLLQTGLFSEPDRQVILNLLNGYIK
ncbi:hypothetical protein GCM10027037_32080 [Mucilaginibacter koreensis]